MDSISHTIQRIYGMDVVVLEGEALPKFAFVNVKSPRYRADKILAYLKKEKLDSTDLVLGLIEADISTTKRDASGNIKKPESKYEDWGVFGLGYRPGPSAIVSTFRFNNVDRDLFMERFQKICIHEVGHNLGLKHCEFDEKCVMRDAAETINTVDNVEMKLCSRCRGLIGL